LLLSQHVELSSALLSEQVSLLRTLLLHNSKVGSRFIQFMLNELDDARVLLITREREKHVADGRLADRRSHALDCLPFEVTQMEEPIARGAMTLRPCGFQRRGVHSR
jgi:hypothetical protein